MAILMLTALRTGNSFRFAILLAIFAALCFVAPPAALAFGHGSATADCMAHANMVGHGKLSQDTINHGDHSAPAGDDVKSCCGLFCMSALAVDAGVVEPAAILSTPYPARETILFSRILERLDRPPISLHIV